MNFQIVWHPAAQRQLENLGWHPSESVDAVVIRFAETGRGDVEWIPPPIGSASGSTACGFTIDRAARTMNVLAVYRAR